MASRKGLTKTRHPGVYRRDKDGVFVAYVGVRVEGKTKFRTSTLPAGATVEDAVREAARLRQAIRVEAQTPMPHPQATSRVHDVRTVEDYGHQWLDAKKARLKPSAYQHYEHTVMKRILPWLGHLGIDDVCRGALESWVAWAEGQRKANGDPYSQDTLRTWWRPLKTMMSDLAADFGIPDPTRRVRPPESHAPRVREEATLTVEELGEFLGAVKQLSPNRYAEVATLAWTGMRAGELYGLKWECVDFHAERIVIQRSVSKGELTETTKTKAARVVPMYAELVAVLQEHRQDLLKQQHRGLQSGLVFPAQTGGVRTPQSLKKVFVLAREATGLSVRVGPQVLRRTFNTLMVQAGVDRITLRAMMGHTSEAMTERYAGVSLDAKRAALAAVMDDTPDE
ncbi:MAG: tyrosine-type recombinase/integrase [Myxococcota bacterium]